VTVTINGSGFALGDKLRVTCGFATDPTITSQSTATSLVVTIPNSDLQIEGSFGCTVQDVTSGNSTYPPVNFGVTTACPTQGNEAALANGSPEWMFLVKGENGGNPMAMAGIFAPNGTGGILFGTEDTNQIGSAPDVNEAMIQPSSYSEDSSGRGCLEFHTAKGLKIFHFTRTQMMEFDDTTGNGERAVGQCIPLCLPVQWAVFLVVFLAWRAGTSLAGMQLLQEISLRKAPAALASTATSRAVCATRTMLGR